MHDGPAQSLTNIILQAQIVQRLVGTDPTRAAQRWNSWWPWSSRPWRPPSRSSSMSARWCWTTWAWCRPCEGPPGTAAAAAKVTIDFDSVGADRRLPGDVESALFRCTDEAITGYLEAASQHIVMRMDWTDHDVTTRLTATPPAAVGPGAGAKVPRRPRERPARAGAAVRRHAAGARRDDRGTGRGDQGIGGPGGRGRRGATRAAAPAGPQLAGHPGARPGGGHPCSCSPMTGRP